MAKRFTDSDKWSKPFIRNMKAPYKLLWLYILDECNHAGIWQVDIDVAKIKIGENIKLETAIEFFVDKIWILDEGQKWFIPDFIEFQYGILNSDNRAHNSVIQILRKYSLIGDNNTINKPLTSPLQGAKDKDMVKDMVKDSIVIIPKIEKHALQLAIESKYKNIARLSNQLTFDEAQRLTTEFKSEDIKAVLLAMENYKELNKKYVSVNLTLRKWMAKELKGNPFSKSDKDERVDIYGKTRPTKQHALVEGKWMVL